MAATKRKPVNWPKLRQDYIEGLPDDADGRVWPTLRMVGSLHGCNEAHVRVRASSEGWVEQRTIFQAKLARTRQLALADMLGQSLAEIDARTIMLSARGLDAIDAFLAAASELAAIEPGANQEGDVPQGIDARSIQQIAAALKGFHGVAHDAAGKPIVDPDAPAPIDIEARNETHASALARMERFKSEGRGPTFLEGYTAGAIEVAATESEPPPSP